MLPYVMELPKYIFISYNQPALIYPDYYYCISNRASLPSTYGFQVKIIEYFLLNSIIQFNFLYVRFIYFYRITFSE